MISSSSREWALYLFQRNSFVAQLSTLKGPACGLTTAQLSTFRRNMAASFTGSYIPDPTNPESKTSDISRQIQSNLQYIKAQLVPYPLVRLVAVSKTKPVSAILAAYATGQRHFGENYVVELAEKAVQLPEDIHWHFIGTLQSNKCKVVTGIPNLWAIESIDSVKKALVVQKAYVATRPPSNRLRIFLQVNTSGEESKGGIEPKACLAAFNTITRECPALHIQGLMTIGSVVHSKETVPNPDFTCLLGLRELLHQSSGRNDLELSMGMSEDYMDAVQQGSTNIRVGSKIFGSR